MLRVLGRWLLYSLVGVLILLLASSGGAWGATDRPRGRARSILLSIAGSVAGLAGGAVLLSHRAGGPLGTYWPHAAVIAWCLGAFLTVAAWVAISKDLRRDSVES